MKSELKRVGLTPPQITTLSNIFHVTIRFAQAKPETLQDMILQYGRDKKTVTTSAVIKIFNLSRPTAIKILNELANKGYAKHSGKTKTSIYTFS